MVDVSTDSSRYPLGCFPECGSPVRLGGGSSHTETVSHYVHQHVLGHWPVLRCSSVSRICSIFRRAGLQNPLRGPVALAGFDTVWLEFRAGVSSIVREKNPMKEANNADLHGGTFARTAAPMLAPRSSALQKRTNQTLTSTRLLL